MATYLLGIDNGGTIAKAAVIGLDGREVAVASRKTEMLAPATRVREVTAYGVILDPAPLAALAQGNVRRLLAYSAIAHAGYTLIGAGLGAIIITRRDYMRRESTLKKRTGHRIPSRTVRVARRRRAGGSSASPRAGARASRRTGAGPRSPPPACRARSALR